MVNAGHEFYQKLTCPKAERIFRSADGGEAHCQMNNPSLQRRTLDQRGGPVVRFGDLVIDEAS